MLTDAQRAEREAKIGSSDAPIVAGVSPYAPPIELYHKLVGTLPRYSEEESQAQRIGSKLEPVIAELAAEDLGLKIRRCPVRVHTKHAWMASHSDFEIVNNSKGPGVLEIKNRSGQHPWDALPDDIMIQAVHQLAVANREWAMVAALFQFGVLRTYEVRRDRELEDYLIEIEAQFIARVQRREPPDTQWDAKSVELLKKLYPLDRGTTIALPAQQAINCQGFLEAKRALEAAEARKALYEGLIKDAITDHSAAVVEGYTISWKSTKASTKFDLERFQEEHPDLAAQYQKTVPGHRRFIVKSSKEILP